MKPLSHRPAAACWCALIALTLLWDGIAVPLHTGRWLLLLKLLPLCLPLRGIWRGRVYTYQYCSMLVLPYFAEGVMRLFDAPAGSLYFAALQTAAATAFFVLCLRYLYQFKSKHHV
ncbi:DUF2069 domain-containing protein [Conchiformibius kuhniae]|uniref:DUF2069 domain-containing protein n=1 Tax=Conchiformibius kuhniae TaxID=211502 RepID=A0ABD8B822_9NEIS|nr:DUF2069 domain-containing protein [Conchiformibius kuhniae]